MSEPHCIVIETTEPVSCACGVLLKAAHMVERDGEVEHRCARCCPVHRDVDQFLSALCEAVPAEVAS